MKKYIMKFLGGLLVFCIIFLFCAKIVDLHRDGIVLRDGTYYFNSAYHNGLARLVVDVTDGMDQVDTSLRLWPVNYSYAQQFELENIEGHKYIIRYGSLCLGVNDDTQDVVLQEYNGQEEQQWDIERINSSQYFRITNAKSGLSMEAVKEQQVTYYAIKVTQYIQEDKSFYFQL